MNRNQKISIIQDELLSWYEIHHRKFPWRKKSMNAYKYIIAETLLQRTRAETISRFYPVFISKYPNWKSIDIESHTDLAEFLKPIGLYFQRAERLKRLSHEMLLLKGRIPEDKSELERIPFIGQYIANAILLFVHNQPKPLLDVNMSRVLERIFGDRKMVDIRYDPYLQKLANDFVNHKHSKKLNWALLDFAALTCKPKPNCETCPMVRLCKYYKTHSKSK